MADRNNWDSEKIKSLVREKRTKCGYKFTRQLRSDEQKAFLDEDKVPTDAISKSTFLSEKKVGTIPSMKCLCCGADLSEVDGWVVEVNAEPNLRTICDKCHSEVVASNANECNDDEAPTTAPTTPTTTANPTELGLQAALQTITAALAAPKVPPVDEAKIIAEACARARDAAKDVMRESVKDFITNGTTPSASADKKEEPTLPSAKHDGVEAATKASSWSAKATPDGVAAVEKLSAFLSEFSYFRSGVSMRLINTFARAVNKSEALRNYCEVAQMEDLPELIEKMKSPEFTQVCQAYNKVKSPSPVNKRFAVFYGAPGGGKTYTSIEACKKINGDNNCETVPCSPSMDAADMLYAYRLDYQSGKRGYVPTALLKAMLTGRAVVLDEVNLLPMEARMFLQNILDNKNKVSVMGVEIPIKDGFFVIGTMNLETGLGASPLPLPLVDRACVVKEFKTTSAQAAVGAGLC